MKKAEGLKRKCSMQCVPNVENPARCRLGLPKEGQYTAETATGQEGPGSSSNSKYLEFSFFFYCFQFWIALCLALHTCMAAAYAP